MKISQYFIYFNDLKPKIRDGFIAGIKVGISIGLISAALTTILVHYLHII